METDKTSKYFKYAIGEIVLVVIGILIALQINNWNENRKQVNTQNAIYQTVKEDLETDILEFEPFIKEYFTVRKPAFDSVLNKELTRKDWKDNPNYSTVISGYKDLALSRRGLDLLKNLSSLSNNLEQELTTTIDKFYNKHLTEISVGTEELGDQFVRNYNYYQNFEWYSSYLMNGNINGFVDSYYNDQSIKSRLAVFYFIFEIYIAELQSYLTNAKVLIIDIDNHLKNNQN
ncbi:DUF6090 family protein [Winogradskyella sp. PC D3.3]